MIHKKKDCWQQLLPAVSYENVKFIPCTTPLTIRWEIPRYLLSFVKWTTGMVTSQFTMLTSVEHHEKWGGGPTSVHHNFDHAIQIYTSRSFQWIIGGMLIAILMAAT